MTDAELDTALTDAYAEGRRDQLDFDMAEISVFRAAHRAALAQPVKPASLSDEPDGPTSMMLDAHIKLAAWIRASPVQPVLAQPVKPAIKETP